MTLSSVLYEALRPELAVTFCMFMVHGFTSMTGFGRGSSKLPRAAGTRPHLFRIRHGLGAGVTRVWRVLIAAIC